MKHTDDLMVLMAALGMGMPPNADLMLEHLAWVLETNKRVNLTRITDEDDALRLHLVDSLTALPEVDDAPQGALLDLGTGAGYPGIPLALASGRETLLVDSVGKKVRAIDEFLEEESIEGITTSSSRAEELAVSTPGGWAIVTARAVTALPSLVELSAPLLKPGGRLIAMKGPIDQVELDRGTKAAAIVGLKVTSQRFLSLPGGQEGRSILVFERVGKPSMRLPRRNGLAQKRPLA